MPATIIPFIAHRTRVRLREASQIARFVNRYAQYVPPTKEEEAELESERLRHKGEDLEWSRRHGQIRGGAVIVPFPESAAKAPALGQTANGC
jgi:hypothetical protein